jgi:acetolactate synthase-1/2/3 large subunit
MPALVRQAFREATTGRPGPAALFFPQDVLDGPAGGLVRAGGAARFSRFPAFRPPPEPQDTATAAGLLREARRPFILAGGGVMHSGAGSELTELAARVGAAVGTTLSGKGAIAEDHPLSVGVTGSMGTSAAAAAFAEADVVLLVGTKSGSAATYGWTLPRPGQAVIGLDIDPAELGRAFGLDAAMLADARAGLSALLTALGEPTAGGCGAKRGSSPRGNPAEEPGRGPRQAWRARVAGLAAAWRAERDAERASDAVPVAPQRVLAELEAALGPGDVLVCDASLASGWGGVYLEQRSPGRRMLCPRGQAGLGYGVPAAIGVAASGAAGRVVVLTGDGALGYASGELATLAEQALPVTVVVLNNRSLGWIRWYRRITFGRGWEDEDFSDVAFADVAAAYGLAGRRVTEPGLLAGALREALAGPGPALLDVVTDAWQTPITAHRRALAGDAAGQAPGGRPTGYGG